MDARIGVLNSGKFYAYPNGYHAEPVIGTLQEVELALGLRSSVAPTDPVQKSDKRYSVLLTFEFPAWDEVNGLEYRDIGAASKSEANAIARSKASQDGHLVSGKGRYHFKATEQE